MFKIAVVIFRECLEMAIVLGIIFAATKNVRNRGFYIVSGVLGGVFCAALLAFFIGRLSASLDGVGDEIFDASVILLTVVVIGWTAVWMQGYTLYIKQEVDSLASQISSSHTHQIVLATMVGGTIFREISEIILFVYGLVTSSSIESADCLMGLLVGATGGISLGIALYCGLLKLAGKYIFKICSILLIFIAAGLAAEAAGILTSIGVIKHLTYVVWDSSWLIPDNSIGGKILKILIGYEAKPNIMQLIFYGVTLATLLTLSKWRSRNFKAKKE
ncbi:MAG: FTR1 family protein [Pseudomonadota bacterium]